MNAKQFREVGERAANAPPKPKPAPLACAKCHHLIEASRRGSGVAYCSELCESLAPYEPGDLHFTPTTSAERKEHRKLLKTKNY